MNIINIYKHILRRKLNYLLASKVHCKIRQRKAVVDYKVHCEIKKHYLQKRQLRVICKGVSTCLNIKMENFQTIIESIQGTIKIVTYNKPKRKNAIDIDMYKRVTKILHDCANDSTVSMMVFTGAGDYFSSGNDLVAARTVHTPSFLQVLHDFIEAFITFPKLLVAVVNGPAVGIAVTTLPLCDLVFAVENAFFYTPFGKLGFTAEGCSSYTFPRIIGHGKALEMLLFDQKMNAKEAFDYGLVNYIYKPEEIQTKVWNRLTEISNVSNDLVTTTKRLIRSSIQDKLLKVNDEEIRLLNEAWGVRNQKQDSCTIKSKI